eukprot:11208469-Lingulodinium_polyedra.AAC.1
MVGELRNRLSFGLAALTWPVFCKALFVTSSMNIHMLKELILEEYSSTCGDLLRALPMVVS